MWKKQGVGGSFQIFDTYDGYYLGGRCIFWNFLLFTKGVINSFKVGVRQGSIIGLFFSPNAQDNFNYIPKIEAFFALNELILKKS